MKTYQPGYVPDDPAQLAAFLRSEFLAIKQAAERAEPYIRLTPTTVAPAKVQDGDLYEAKAPWNPGTGDGLYLRRAGAWIKVA